MSEITFCWRDTVSFVFALILSFGLIPGAADAQDFVEYQPNTTFENWVRKANPACMPKPLEISTEPYAYRVLRGVYAECAPSHYNPDTGSFDKLNMSEEEANKWAALAVGSLVNPVVAGYASGEVLTAGGKCVLRSFIDASDTATPSTKETLKAAVDGAGTLLDWYQFADAIPELANPKRAKSIEAAVSVYLSSIDRLPEGASALEFLKNSWSSGIQSLREFNDGPRITAWKAVQSHMDQCEFDKAGEQLKLARAETDKACEAYGESYRQAQKNMSIFMSTNRKQVDLPFGSGDEAKKNYNTYLGFIEGHKAKLTELINFYDEIDRFEASNESPKKKSREFWEMQSQYYVFATLAHNGLGTKQGCLNTAKAIKLVGPENMSAQCRVTFFDTKSDGTPSPEFLVSDLADYSYQQRAERWAALEDVRSAYLQCEQGTRDQKATALRDLVLNKPMYRVIDGACHELTQPELLAQLDKISKKMPDHCAMTTVPKAIIGLTTTEAGIVLEASKLFLSGPFTVVPLKEGAKPNTIIDSQPSPGKSLRIWSPVTVTIYDKANNEAPIAALVDVPTVIGLTDDAARKALDAVGLVAGYAEEVAADQEAMVPGNIHAASHISGDQLPVGSIVTLTRIGPRPNVAVPSIAGAKTWDEVQAILAGAKLATDNAFEVETMPEGAAPGEFFASDPVADTQVEMFSIVTPLRYPSNLRPVPSVLTMKAVDAVKLINKDGFFTGVAAPGRLAKEGEEPLQVLSVSPSVGTMLPKGSVVTVTVIMARTDLEDAPEEGVIEAVEEEPVVGALPQQIDTAAFSGKLAQIINGLQSRIETSSILQSLGLVKDGVFVQGDARTRCYFDFGDVDTFRSMTGMGLSGVSVDPTYLEKIGYGNSAAIYQTANTPSRTSASLESEYAGFIVLRDYSAEPGRTASDFTQIQRATQAAAFGMGRSDLGGDGVGGGASEYVANAFFDQQFRLLEVEEQALKETREAFLKYSKKSDEHGAALFRGIHAAAALYLKRVEAIYQQAHSTDRASEKVDDLIGLWGGKADWEGLLKDVRANVAFLKYLATTAANGEADGNHPHGEAFTNFFFKTRCIPE